MQKIVRGLSADRAVRGQCLWHAPSSDLMKEINNQNNDNIKDNNNIKYKINLEILYIIESKLQNI